MTIEITQEDIQRGCRCDPDCDPVGRALSRAGIAHFGVLGTAVVVEDGTERALVLKLPAEVSEWLFSFDRFEPVSPITFELALPNHHEEPPLAAAA